MTQNHMIIRFSEPTLPEIAFNMFHTARLSIQTCTLSLAGMIKLPVLLITMPLILAVRIYYKFKLTFGVHSSYGYQKELIEMISAKRKELLQMARQLYLSPNDDTLIGPIHKEFLEYLILETRLYLNDSIIEHRETKQHIIEQIGFCNWPSDLSQQRQRIDFLSDVQQPLLRHILSILTLYKNKGHSVVIQPGPMSELIKKLDSSIIFTTPKKNPETSNDILNIFISYLISAQAETHDDLENTIIKTLTSFKSILLQISSMPDSDNDIHGDAP